MERKIDEVFYSEEYKTNIVVKPANIRGEHLCMGCICGSGECMSKDQIDIFGDCCSDLRKDQNDVIFCYAAKED